VKMSYFPIFSSVMNKITVHNFSFLKFSTGNFLSAIVSFLFLCSVISSAQTMDFSDQSRWTHFTTESGLPSNHINQIYEGRDGTMWVLTQNGLAYYDGFQWVPLDSSKGIPHNPLTIFSCEIGNNIIVGNNSNIFIGTKDGFRKIPLENVSSAVYFRNDTLLLTQNNQLKFYYHGILGVYSFPFPLATVRGFYGINSDALLFADEYNIYRWKNNRWNIHFSLLSKLDVWMLEENRNGSGIMMCYGSKENTGVWEWKSQTIPKRSVTEKFSYNTPMAIGPNDEAIISYQSDYVRVRENDKWYSPPFVPEEMKGITILKFRSNGDLWLGTRTGLNIFRRSTSRWSSIQLPQPDMRNNINEVVQTRDRNIWLGTSEGVTIIQPNGTLQFITEIKNKPVQNVTGIAEDNEGNVWLSSGSSFSGAYRWDGKEWEHFIISNDSGFPIHKIRIDRKGGLWFLGLGFGDIIATENSPGAYLFENGKFTRWGEEEGLLNGRVYAFAESNDSAFWFGTIGGISRWKNGKWKYWTSADGLQSTRVFTLAVDKNNRAWFGDNISLAGLGYIDEKDKIHYLTTKDGIANEEIWDVRVDSSGILWVATSKGLCSYINGDWRVYTEKSGLHHEALWPIFPTAEKVYVGTRGKGLAILDRNIEISPPPRIIMQQPVIDEKDALLRWKLFSYYGEIEPGEILSRFRIDKDSWSSWSTLHEIAFYHLDAGKHSVEIQAKGVFGQYTTKGGQRDFYIQAPYYLRPLFYVPAGMLVVGFLFLGGTLINRKRKYDKNIKANEERYRIITELMADYAYLDRVNQNGSIEIIWLTESFTRLTGYSIGETKVRGFFYAMFHPDDREIYVQHFQKLLSGERVQGEARIITKTGKVIWGFHDATPIRNEMTGQVTHIYGVVRDITKRKDDEEQLKMLADEVTENEKRYRILTELMADYAYYDEIDENGNYTMLWMTESFERVTGYTVEESRAPDFVLKYVYPDDIPKMQANYLKLVSGKADSGEGRIITKDGQVKWLLHHAVPIWDNKLNRVTHLYGIARDITERKQNEERLRTLTSELMVTEERERRRMAEYLHDAVGSTLALCKMKFRSLEKYLSPDVVQESFSDVRTLLDQSIKNTRTLTFDLSPPILYELRFESALQSLAEQLLDEHHILFTFSDDKSEKPIRSEVRVILFYAVRETLLNIVKHSAARHVNLSLMTKEDNFIITIVDDGKGFDVTQMGKSANRESGFGLFSLRERLSYLGGTLEIHSLPGKGTTVTMQTQLQKL